MGVMLVATAGAAASPISPVEHDHTPGCLVGRHGATATLRLEVADTPDRRARGLMHREHLPADAGMVFVFEQERPGNAGFWMHNTLIPLDIAFMDDRGEILRILTMEPCRHTNPLRCRNYRPGIGYHLALETNAGFFAHHGFDAGDRLVLGSDCTDSGAAPHATPPTPP